MFLICIFYTLELIIKFFYFIRCRGVIAIFSFDIFFLALLKNINYLTMNPQKRSSPFRKFEFWLSIVSIGVVALLEWDITGTANLIVLAAIFICGASRMYVSYEVAMLSALEEDWELKLISNHVQYITWGFILYVGLVLSLPHFLPEYAQSIYYFLLFCLTMYSLWQIEHVFTKKQVMTAEESKLAAENSSLQQLVSNLQQEISNLLQDKETLTESHDSMYDNLQQATASLQKYEDVLQGAAIKKNERYYILDEDLSLVRSNSKGEDLKVRKLKQA